MSKHTHCLRTPADAGARSLVPSERYDGVVVDSARGIHGAPIELPCAACSHAWESHDPIGARYCSATMARGLDRACACTRPAEHENLLPIGNKAMAIETPYERRVIRVRDVVRTYSGFDDNAATELAVQVLHALDTIPEKIR